AQSLLDKAVAFSGEIIRDEDLKEVLGTISREILFSFSKAILEEKPEEIFNLVEKVVEYGYDLRFFYKELIQHFRNMLLVKSVKSPQDLLPLNEEEIDDLNKEAEKASREELLRYLVVLQGGEQELKFSSHPRIYLEVFLIKLCHFKKIVDMKDIIKDIENLKKGMTSPSAKPFPEANVQEPTRTPQKEESKPPEPEMKEPLSPEIEKEKGKRGREIEMAMKDPSVKSFMDTFKARVLSVKPVERTEKKG
ncbi:MAG: DNA polymerase III subunit gamma/tau, partial [Candidatus Aminicenantes bacterium]|nr:DNA polymerase III subunit gamma/tau [Candidatus Aminicenantes bacterium]